MERNGRTADNRFVGIVDRADILRGLVVGP
jgi:hypothetical protein